MTGRIFVLDDEGSLRAMSEEAYDSEELLQSLLTRYPDLLAGDQMNRAAPRRWLLIQRETGVLDGEGGANRWALDHLFIDQEAIPTLVEVKRGTDSRLRQEVVGQMLDYAANGIAHWPVEQLRSSFEAACEREGYDPEERIQELVGQDGDAQAFWQQVKINLRAGRLRMVFVADEIPVELQRIIEFLNSQTDPAEILGVEVRRYDDGSQTTLVPRVIGVTAEAQQRKTGTRQRRDWYRAALITEIKNGVGPRAAEVADRLLDWAVQQQLRLWWGSGAKLGSCYVMLDHHETKHWTFAIWTSGSVAVQFGMMTTRPMSADLDVRLGLAERLSAIRGVSLGDADLGRSRSIRLTALADRAAFDAFVAAFDWYVGRIRRG